MIRGFEDPVSGTVVGGHLNKKTLVAGILVLLGAVGIDQWFDSLGLPKLTTIIPWSFSLLGWALSLMSWVRHVRYEYHTYVSGGVGVPTFQTVAEWGFIWGGCLTLSILIVLSLVLLWML